MAAERKPLRNAYADSTDLLACVIEPFAKGILPVTTAFIKNNDCTRVLICSEAIEQLFAMWAISIGAVKRPLCQARDAQSFKDSARLSDSGAAFNSQKISCESGLTNLRMLSMTVFLLSSSLNGFLKGFAFCTPRRLQRAAASSSTPA